MSTLLISHPPASLSVKSRRAPAAGARRPNTEDAIARAVLHLAQRWQSPPSLQELAQDVAGMSPAHFQRLFKARVGISPKRFCQQLTLTHAKDLLTRRVNLLDASLSSGLSGPGRLHDLFVSGEAMTPGEYKQHGRALVIHWGVCESPIGASLIAITDRGVCWLGFSAGDADIQKLKRNWSEARLIRDDARIAGVGRRVFYPRPRGGVSAPLPVLLRGTNFQIQVWRALLRIPNGAIATYGDVAGSLERQTPGAARPVRAVAAACGTNPVSYIIPCHRVIQSTGALCGYGWGLDKKRALLALENTQRSQAASK